MRHILSSALQFESLQRECDIVVLALGSSNRFEERKAFVLTHLAEMKHKTLLKTKMHPSRGRRI